MEVYRKIVSTLHDILLYAVSAGLVIMIVLTALEVVRRYYFGLSFSWSEELVRYLMIMVTFFGGAVAYRDKGLVALDLITGKFSKKGKAIAGLCTEVLTIIIVLLLLIYTVKAITQPAVYMQKSIGLKISMAVPWLSMPIGLGAMLVFAPEHFISIVEELSGGKGVAA